MSASIFINRLITNRESKNFGKLNGAVKGHPKVLEALASKYPYKFEVTDTLISVTGEGILSTPFNCDGTKAEVLARFQEEVLKKGLLISYTMGVSKGGVVLQGTRACGTLENSLPIQGGSAIIGHASIERAQGAGKKTVKKPSFADPTEGDDLTDISL